MHPKLKKKFPNRNELNSLVISSSKNYKLKPEASPVFVGFTAVVWGFMHKALSNSSKTGNPCGCSLLIWAGSGKPENFCS